jgi:hypothetical protein
LTAGFTKYVGANTAPANPDKLLETFRWAAIGGTASVLTGGKFANGAQTAAFQYTVNGALQIIAGVAVLGATAVVVYDAKQIAENVNKFNELNDQFIRDPNSVSVEELEAARAAIFRGVVEMNKDAAIGLYKGTATRIKNTIDSIIDANGKAKSDAH